MDTDVCIIGAGPAGLTAAIFASSAGAKTTVIEKNTTAGRKLLLTGGGRCNLTHLGTSEEFVRAYGRAGRFLQHCLYEFSAEAVCEFFNEMGVATEADDEGCVFPISQRASEVRDVLIERCRELGVRFVYGRAVERIEKGDVGFQIHLHDQVVTAGKVIIATGGSSYPQTGSTGDGYGLAKSLGHTIIEPRPALVPLVTKEKWQGELAGTSVDSVGISAKVDGKRIASAGAMLFTQDGIGGPAVLDLSRHLADWLPTGKPIEIIVDYVPANSETELDKLFVVQLSKQSRKAVANAIAGFVPRRLAGVVCNQAGVADETTGSQLEKEKRRDVVRLLKKMPISIKAARPVGEATITRGGVAISEIEAVTMQSRICRGVYFAGEVIDADGPCGGYNLQIAWSTGAVAGKQAI